MQHKENFTLTWHNYSDHLLKALEEMMTSSAFADVTLVTDDKQQIRAHRNILSACSPVFKKILQLDSGVNTNPIIYLRGIQHAEMESIMQFIYFGETRFYKERMSEILMVAKNLEIQELSTAEMNNEMVSNEESNVNESSVVLNEDTYQDPTQNFSEGDSNYIHQTNTSTQPSKPIIKNKASKKNIKTKDSKSSCNKCDKQLTGKGNLIRHIHSPHEGVASNQCENMDIAGVPPHALDEETQIVEIYNATKGTEIDKQFSNKSQFQCKQCDKSYYGSGGLSNHNKSVHEGVKYPCDQCDYQATQQSSLKTHIQSKYEGDKDACNQCEYQAAHQSNVCDETY